MDTLTPTLEDPGTPEVCALLQRHFELMRAQSPEDSCHVMAPDALTGADVSLMGLRRAGALLGIGALSRLDGTHGELKSMHTAVEARGQGVARALVRALLDMAREKGMTKVSLETGSDAAFGAARALYMSEGFQDCAPFATYKDDPLSVFMSRSL